MGVRLVEPGPPGVLSTRPDPIASGPTRIDPDRRSGSRGRRFRRRHPCDMRDMESDPLV